VEEIMQEVVEMSKKELDRHHIIKKLIDKQITQKKAAQLMNLKSDRQIRNLLASYHRHGVKGLISKQRGKPSNRSYNYKFKSQIMALVRERYHDFGPTFASEKLLEYHNITISKETLRKWMIEEHLWIQRKKRQHIYPLRPRREYFGELIQIDASHHYWLEDRWDKCALIVFIDDATSKITSLCFCATECLQGYFTALRDHILKYGRPLSLYSDRHAIFGGSDKIHHAQFIRAIKELNIESILARSPQAKGRVERVNQTLQDRLVKEMRLRNICTIDEANQYLPEFIEEFNRKFSKEPRGQFDAHRPLDSGLDLERTLTRCEIRTLSKDLSFSFYNTTYQILETSIIKRLKNKKIEIRTDSEGTMRVFYADKELSFIPIKDYIGEQTILDCKDKLVWKPGRGGNAQPKDNSHPWKRYGYQIKLGNDLKRMAVI
jgi:hypothetical protein